MNYYKQPQDKKQVKVCGIFIFNSKLELLLHNNSIPKGTIYKSEKYLYAAIREVYNDAKIDFANYQDHYFLPVSYQSNFKQVLIPFVIFGEDNLKGNFISAPIDDAMKIIDPLQKLALTEIKNRYITTKKYQQYLNGAKVENNSYYNGQGFGISNIR